MSETAAVTLRRLEAADWPAVYSWGRLPEFCRFQPWGPDTEEQSRGYTAAAAAAWSQSPQTRFPYLACADGRPIGVGEVAIRQPRHRHGEIPYGVHPDSWGRGRGTAMGRELLRIGFGELGLHRVCATCDPRNLGSAGVIRRLGMTYEGRQRHTMLIRDGRRDSDVYSILEDEWRTR